MQCFRNESKEISSAGTASTVNQLSVIDSELKADLERLGDILDNLEKKQMEKISNAAFGMFLRDHGGEELVAKYFPAN